MNITFKDRTVLITGATRGIGKAMAGLFEKANANLILTGTNKKEIEKLNAQSENPWKKYFVLDFGSESSINSFIKKLKSYHQIDVCINNAGINIIDEFIDSKNKDYNSMMNINLKGPYLLNKYCAAKMKDNGYGRIVNICSIWSAITRPKRALYTMTKNALHGMTQTMAVELAMHNILVNSVSPGFTLTELTKSTNSKQEIESISEKIPIKRMADPKEIAKVIMYLASEQNSYLTGQNIIVDGGYVIV